MVRRPFERIGCIRPEGGDGTPGRIIVEGEPFDGELLALSLGHQIQQVLVDFHGHFGLVAQQLYLGRRIEIIDFPAVPQYQPSDSNSGMRVCSSLPSEPRSSNVLQS